jgi:adenine-specific DNA-methyltransferase
MDNEKLDGLSMNIERTERDKLRAVFPECFVEGRLDIDKLLTMCGEYITDDFEKYEFKWKGKSECLQLAQKRSTGTLRPCKGESVNFDTTQNIYIEGDNLEVLKLLQTSYYRKVKMIYIDPPYNTGNDFVYEDDFKDPIARYKEMTSQTTKSNSESMGRFHTAWLNMMYPRLRLAANLLREDGVCFISIDDHEIHNLRKLCDEVFGEENFVAELVWERAYSPKNDAKYISNSHDYVLMYAKRLEEFQIGRLERTEEANARYQNPDNDPRGVWKPSDMSVKTYSPDYDYPITAPSGRVIEPPTGRCWRLSKNAFFERLQDDRIWFGSDGNSVPQIKRFLNELKFEGMAPQSIMFYKDVGHSQEGAKELTTLLEAGAFQGPKPIRLLRRLLTLANLDCDSIVLDFFSGSATTAHAVMQLNAEDGSNRRFIMVQLPELCDEKSESLKAGYKNICEIGKERIRRAGSIIYEQGIEKWSMKKISEEQLPETIDEDGMIESGSTANYTISKKVYGKEDQSLDIGFRVFKLDESNFKIWDNTPIKDGNLTELERRLRGMLEVIKDDRTNLDVVYEVMLKLGQDLCEDIVELDINGKTVYGVGADVTFIVCLAEHITPEDAEGMAEYAPGRIIFSEQCFDNTTDKSNVKLTMRNNGINMRML